MNPSTATLSLNRSAGSSRDHGGHRRAYLDTYARKRAGLPAEAPKASQAVQQEVSTATAMPMYVTSAPFQTITAQQVPTPQTLVPTQSPAQISHQPQVTQESFKYTPAQASSAQSTSSHSEKQKIYLDSIIRRSPEAQTTNSPVVEQVQQSIVKEVEAPLQYEEQSANSSKIEANLRALYLDEDSLTKALMQDEKSASLSHMRTIVASAFACGVIAVSMFTFFSRAGSQPVVAQPVGAPVIEVEAPLKQPTGSDVSTSTQPRRVAVNANHPVRIIISSIGVNAPVEGVGQTSDGLMAVPNSYGIVGWYNKGSYPGQKGPAVLAGHYTGGYGGVFDKLADLKDGDLITTTNGKGESITYKVVKKVEYEKDQVPMAELFKGGDESRLEIITCSGKWQANTYNKRLVVTAELVR